MPKICYVEKRFSPATLRMIEQANAVIATYAAQGFDLTLRQLYYQFVSRDLLANRDTEYKRLGGIMSDARLAGLIDWQAIVDRTRNVRHNAHWDEPSDIMTSALTRSPSTNGRIRSFGPKCGSRKMPLWVSLVACANGWTYRIFLPWLHVAERDVGGSTPSPATCVQRSNTDHSPFGRSRPKRQGHDS